MKNNCFKFIKNNKNYTKYEYICIKKFSTKIAICQYCLKDKNMFIIINIIYFFVKLFNET